MTRFSLLLVAIVVSACGYKEPTVGKSRLATADGVEPAPAGPTVELPGGELPAGVTGTVRLAIDRDMPYDDVRAFVARARAAGVTPVFLVHRREEIFAMPGASETLGKDPIKLRATIEGKACVSPPDNEEATCIKRKDQNRIDRAFVRRILQKAVREWGLKNIHVVLEPGLTWADAVRAIDGARTCCVEKDLRVTVDPPLL